MGQKLSGVTDAALFHSDPEPRNGTEMTQRNILVSCLYILALILLALPYGLSI